MLRLVIQRTEIMQRASGRFEEWALAIQQRTSKPHAVAGAAHRRGRRRCTPRTPCSVRCDAGFRAPTLNHSELPLNGHARRLQLRVRVPEFHADFDGGGAVLFEIDVAEFGHVSAGNHLFWAKRVDDFGGAADGDIDGSWHGLTAGHADHFDRAIFEFGFTQPASDGDADVCGGGADVARANGGGVDGNATAMNAGAEPGDVERGESRELHYLDHAHGAAHRELGGIDVGLAFDHVAFGGLSGDGGLQWDLSGHDVFPLQLDRRWIDDVDGGVGWESEVFRLEADRFTVPVAQIDFDRDDARLDLAIDGAGRATQRDVNARRDGRHQFAFGALGRQAHHDRHGDGALLFVRLPLQECEQAQGEGHGQRLEAEVLGERLTQEGECAGEERRKHQGSLWREPPSPSGSSAVSGSLPCRAWVSEVETEVVIGVRSGAIATAGGGIEGRNGGGASLVGRARGRTGEGSGSARLIRGCAGSTSVERRERRLASETSPLRREVMASKVRRESGRSTALSRCGLVCAFRLFLRTFGLKMASNIVRSLAPSRLLAMLPLKQKLIVPRSSLTITTTASVSSVMPSAARWREPKLSSTTRPSGIGKNTPALAMRRLRITTEPSCSLFMPSGKNSATKSSRVTCASSVCPLWTPTNSSRFASCSKVMSAPMRWRASSVAASTTSSITLVSWARTRLPNQARLPTRCRPRRMSLWNTTTTISSMLEISAPITLITVTSRKACATRYSTNTSDKPSPTCMARVPRSTTSARYAR